MKRRFKLRDKSVRVRILITLVSLTLFCIAFIWAAQGLFLSRIYLNIKKREMNAAAHILLAEEPSSIQDQCSALGAEKAICVAAYVITDGKAGADVGAYEAKPNCNCLLHRLFYVNTHQPPPHDPGQSLGRTLILDAVKSAEEHGGAGFIDSSPVEEQAVVDENQTAVYTKQINERQTLAIFLNTSVVPVDAAVTTMNVMMITLSGVVILFAVFIGLALSLQIARPIEEINETAKKLAKMDYSAHFEGKGYSEVAELSDTLNFAASELSAVDRLQKELVANISHDLRTPLTLISGYAEVMRDLPDENNEQNLQIIIDESNRMKALVNDVLDISRLETGAQMLTLENVPLTNSIESELTRYNKLRDREGYTIEFRYREQVTVRGDHQRLMQVVYNLVNNAVNYAGEDKKVIVSQTVRGNRVRISITDHGVGIAPEELPKIWDRYYKVDKTHKRATVGSGLGLSIVRGIVKAHGGEYGVDSTLGVGSTFWFELDACEISGLPETPENELSGGLPS